MTYEKARDIVEKTIKVYSAFCHKSVSEYHDPNVEDPMWVNKPGGAVYAIHKSTYTITTTYFDPSKLSADIRSEYEDARNAMIELEQNNSALFKQTGYDSVSKMEELGGNVSSEDDLLSELFKRK